MVSNSKSRCEQCANGQTHYVNSMIQNVYKLYKKLKVNKYTFIKGVIRDLKSIKWKVHRYEMHVIFENNYDFLALICGGDFFRLNCF